jgi:hypothetical protein
MFTDSAELYDAIYSFKDYARECDRLRNSINASVPGTRTVLDVAKTTGCSVRATLATVSAQPIEPSHGETNMEVVPVSGLEDSHDARAVTRMLLRSLGIV